jgi:hypothetical protein
VGLPYEIEAKQKALAGKIQVIFESRFEKLAVKVAFSGCSKMLRCKAPEIPRSEAYLNVRRNDEG